MEKKVIVDCERGPKPVGKTNWTQIRAKQDASPIIDEECPEFTIKAGLFHSGGKQK